MDKTCIRRGVLLLTASALILTWLSAPAGAAGYQFRRQLHPARTEVTDLAGHWVATFTDRSRTVTLAGPTRTFTESGTTAAVSSSVWVRLLDSPFDGTVDTAWLSAELADTSPDVLAIATQYVTGTTEVTDATGTVIAADASYGPLQSDGTRAEGSDFNDFLGVTWTYGNVADAPEASQYRSLDCSGFMRMVWGYRSGLPLSLAPDGGVALPRRSYEMLDSAPGMVVVRDSGVQVTKLGPVRPGDLVFFDAATDDGTQIDHVGMYLGEDKGGNYRFISSRKSINGPTLGDYKGKSIVNGTGLYATSFRAVRRL